MRYAFRKRDRKLVLNAFDSPAVVRQRPIWKSPVWLFGLVCNLFGSSAGSLIALSVLPVFIVAPLGSLSLVTNGLFSFWILGAKFGGLDWHGTLFILIGSAWISGFGAVPEPHYHLGKMLELYRRPTFMVYFGLYEALVFALAVYEWAWRRRYQEHLKRGYGLLSTSQAAGAIISVQEPAMWRQDRIMRAPSARNAEYTIHDEMTPLCVQSPSVTPTELATPQSRVASAWGFVASGITSTRAHFARYSPSTFSLLGGGTPHSLENMTLEQAQMISGILSGVVAACISSQTLIFAKSGVELLVITIEGQNQFTKPIAWFIVIALIGTGIIHVYYFNRGLRLCNTVILVPIVFSCNLVTAFFNGLVYFNQFNQLGAPRVVAISIGLLILLFGVFLLSQGDSAKSNAESECCASQLSYAAEILDDDERSIDLGSEITATSNAPQAPSV
ncbi:hypothetical protein H4219_004891 [Mycoemilia scoparia]|uniref:Uncharacterized protein n=1 Tax=Mycoemilia scoparia TaxID=417184 RepID=A0A9W7ZWR6_9FUNG|nr:hypothetical protein H4219_004891 [Mycoemilia scoparia]